jgi:uncharacterized protein DUF4258
MTAEILSFGLSRPMAEVVIHRPAAKGRFTIEPHAKEDMARREFTMRQALRAIEEGSVNQGPRLDECNDWRCRIKKRAAGRLVRVVVAIHDMDWPYVISVH